MNAAGIRGGSTLGTVGEISINGIDVLYKQIRCWTAYTDILSLKQKPGVCEEEFWLISLKRKTRPKHCFTGERQLHLILASSEMSLLRVLYRIHPRKYEALPLAYVHVPSLVLLGTPMKAGLWTSKAVP